MDKKLDLTNLKILVTGGKGFLGKRLCDTLIKQGYADVISLQHSQCDLTRQDDTFRLINSIKPDLIFHLAAKVGGIGANSHNPGQFFYKNMVMGLNVLEAARQYRVSKVVNVGTVCAYPKFTPTPFSEDELWNGYPEETNAPYGIAKRALLVMCQSYRKEYGSNFVMAFPTNLYGPGDNFDPATSHVIPAMIRKFTEAIRNDVKQVILWGDGSPTREFLYVDDAAKALILTAEYYNSPEPMNLGTGTEISMKDLAEQIKNIVGYTGEISWDKPRPNGQPRRMLDISRAKECIGFSATTTFDIGLKETIDWYMKNKY
jgi:GDP-L-fucose synthase